LFHKGINRDIVLAKAVEMTETAGDPTVSMQELAGALGVKAPSLHGHVKDMEISYQVAVRCFLVGLHAAVEEGA